MINQRLQVVTAYKMWFDYGFNYHLTSRIPFEYHHLTDQKINHWLCRHVLNPIEKMNHMKIGAISLIVPIEKCIHTLIQSHPCSPDTTSKSIKLLPTNGEKNAFCCKSVYLKTTEYVFDHMYFKDAQIHFYSKELLK